MPDRDTSPSSLETARSRIAQENAQPDIVRDPEPNAPSRALLLACMLDTEASRRYLHLREAESARARYNAD